MRKFKNLKDPTNVVILIMVWLMDCTLAQDLVKVSCRDHDTTITCDCQHVEQTMVLPQLRGDIDRLEVRNCRDLIVEANTVSNTESLHKISFRQINQLVLKSYALSLSRFASNKALIVEFEDVNFRLIDSHAITGNIEEISFVGGQIEQMQPFGFTTTKNSAILFKMERVTIQHLESQAFKKFAVENMIIDNCRFTGNLPTRAFYELEVLNELSIRNNQFLDVHSHAFSFKLVSKLYLSDNRFVSVDGEWLEAFVRDAVTLRGNNFGLTSDIAFRTLAVHRSYQLSERLELRFYNNSVRTMVESKPLPLRFDERFALSIRQLSYNNEWSCDQMDMSVQPPLPRADFFRLHGEQLLFRGAGKQELVPLRQLITEQCQKPSYVAYIVVGSVLMALLLLALLLLLWWRLAQRRKRRKLDVVQPEPRTYKETQIVYQIENAGLLKTDL